MDSKALLEPKKAAKTRNAEIRTREQMTKPQTTNSDSSSQPNITSPTSNRTYDPRMLLNPRGMRTVTYKRDSEPPMNLSLQNGIDLTNSDHDSEAASDGRHLTGNVKRQSESAPASNGFRFLENMHGVERRIDSPAKKAKLDAASGESDVKQPAVTASSAPRRNAGAGDYFKPEEKNEGPTTITVDLTGDDAHHSSDNEIEVTGSRNIKDEQIVCLGMIDAWILAYKTPKPQKVTTQFSSGQWPNIKCTLRVSDEETNSVIQVIDPFGVAFGNIEGDTARALAPTMRQLSDPALRTQPRVLARPKRPNDWSHQPTSGRIRVIINIYSQRRYAKNIGSFFSHLNVWFRPPMISDPGIPVENPQRSDDPSRKLMKTATPRPVSSNTRTVEEATDAISRLFDNQAAEVNEWAETEPPHVIKTPLLSHQKQALTFMLQHERPRKFEDDAGGATSLWRKKFLPGGRQGFIEVVTGEEVDVEPEQVYGGLLADVMGLGKTVEGLALIASTMDSAQQFAESPISAKDEEDHLIEFNSRATLIVAPVSTVKNWEDQIHDHTQAGALKYHVYHGANRIRDLKTLADHDIVITTYGTIAAEFGGKAMQNLSPMRQIRWFRIMLDEAHTIREAKSSQSRAMYLLAANRRWCLTGTPIQNRMEDLGSLTTFLRLYPYDNGARFRQHIVAPLQSGDPNFLKSIRVFIDSFTMRRLRDRIDLPPRTEQVVDLVLSSNERKVHDFFRAQFSVTIEALMEDRKKNVRNGNAYHRVLKGIMILRLTCDHSRELLKQAQLDQLKGETADEPLDLDDDSNLPSINERRAYEHLSLMSEADMDACANCEKPISGDSPMMEAEESAELVRAYVLPCLDILCTDCFSSCKEAFDAQQNESSVACPCCGTTIKPQYVAISKSYAEGLESAPEENVDSGANAFSQGFYSGPSTKVQALLGDLGIMCQESEPLVAGGEPPLKCVIFSEFTSYLDLIQKALTEYGHRYVRIDGSMSLSQRRKVIDALNYDNNVTILLASIKAAGQGLNLTSASRAFIMEPMWNPAAESQAIDRIYRIGQKRPVIVKRYHIVDSIEDKIIAIQQRKRMLAEMSMNRKEMTKMLSKKERGEQSLKAMLDVFKT